MVFKKDESFMAFLDLVGRRNMKFACTLFLVCLMACPFSPIGSAQQIETLPAPAPQPLPSAITSNADSMPVPPQWDATVRIKDITIVDGDREYDVSGMGLVSGLARTGGKSAQTIALAQNFLLSNRIQAGKVDTRSLSAVVVSGKIPAHIRRGETFTVDVSVFDDATSLRGGTLQRTALRGIDNEIYAIAQGQIIAGGLAVGGQAAGVQKNHPTVGRCTATVEREICFDRMPSRDTIRLILLNKEYTTAVRIANMISQFFPRSANALDSGTVEIAVPGTFRNSLPAFVSMIGELRVTPDARARVVINQKTGTVVMGQNVRISKVLFASENLIVSTSETPVTSQPAAYSRGQTVVLPRTQLDVFETGGTYNVVNEGVTVGQLANALNALGVPPSDLIDLFLSLQTQGSLQAELIIE
jgi:flagellar P-ring protein precursor FlgI